MNESYQKRGSAFFLIIFLWLWGKDSYLNLSLLSHLSNLLASFITDGTIQTLPLSGACISCCPYLSWSLSNAKSHLSQDLGGVQKLTNNPFQVPKEMEAT